MRAGITRWHRRIAAAALALAVLLAPAQSALAADRTVTVTTVEYIEIYDEATGQWVPEDGASRSATGWDNALYDASAPGADALARYGPFEVIAPDRVALIGEVDSYTPDEFRRMITDWPGLRRLEIVDCGGTIDDIANLELARLIRAAGLDTHVPAGGSARSGGVELFVAGVHRSADPGAEFVVHAWLDDLGREASQVPTADPAHAAYLAYYRDMGMSAENAQGFYALTNSAPHDAPMQLTLGDLQRFRVLN